MDQKRDTQGTESETALVSAEEKNNGHQKKLKKAGSNTHQLIIKLLEMLVFQGLKLTASGTLHSVRAAQQLLWTQRFLGQSRIGVA